MIDAETPVKAQHKESYTTEQAAAAAVSWCQTHPGWQRICDIDNSDKLYKTYSELTKRERLGWDQQGGEPAWREFGYGRCKVPYGFISGLGKFYRCALDVPRFHNLMMVFKTGATHD